VDEYEFERTLGEGGVHAMRMKDETIIKEITERRQRREKTNWKALRKMVRRSGQGG